MKFSIVFYSCTSENHIPVQEGDWVKASYTLPDGTVKSTTYTIPVIE